MFAHELEALATATEESMQERTKNQGRKDDEPSAQRLDLFRRRPPRLMFARELEALATRTGEGQNITKARKTTNVLLQSYRILNDDPDSWPHVARPVLFSPR